MAINISNLEIKDFFKHLKSLNLVDIWITDPPYPFDNKNGAGRFKFVDGQDGMYSRMSYADLELCYKEMLDLSNPSAGCYVFTDRDGLFHTKESLERVGWNFNNIIVWDKQKMGMGYHWRNQVEYIVYCSKGSTKRFVTSVPNIISAKKPKGLSAKPPIIWEKIMDLQLRDGDVICDPFAGSDPLSNILNKNQNLLSKIKESYSNIYDPSKSTV
jgi:site-specific DNA-methyltransferase (adenine-specific)